MSGVLTRNWGGDIAFRRRTASPGRSFASRKSRKRESNASSADFKSMLFVMAGCCIFAGAFYLYQVNNIAIKGYEMKEVENRIQDLEKENQRLKIREVESRSMYNIEKSTEGLNLINSANITYVEMRGPVAMK